MLLRLQRWIRQWLGIDEVLAQLAALRAMQAPAPVVQTYVEPPMASMRPLGCGHTSTQWATSKRDGSTKCLACYRISVEAS